MIDSSEDGWRMCQMIWFRWRFGVLGLAFKRESVNNKRRVLDFRSATFTSKQTVIAIILPQWQTLFTILLHKIWVGKQQMYFGIFHHPFWVQRGVLEYTKKNNLKLNVSFRTHCSPSQEGPRSGDCTRTVYLLPYDARPSHQRISPNYLLQTQLAIQETWSSFEKSKRRFDQRLPTPAPTHA